MKSTSNEGSLYQCYNKVVLEFADYKKKHSESLENFAKLKSEI